MPKGIKGFQKGHKLFGQGRPKKHSTILKEFIKAHPMAYDEMLEVLYDLAINKTDREAAQYICNRLKGSPHISIDARLKGELRISADQLQIAVIAALAQEQKLLGEGDAIQRLGETEGI